MGETFQELAERMSLPSYIIDRDELRQLIQAALVICEALEKIRKERKSFGTCPHTAKIAIETADKICQGSES